MTKKQTTASCTFGINLFLVFFVQKVLLQRILDEARESVDKLFGAVSDQFELCLAKCRTSSKVNIEIVSTCKPFPY